MKAPYVQRMEIEKAELDQKIELLAGWVGHDPLFNTLVPEEKQEMRDQLMYMRGYSQALSARLRRALARHS